jgi:hypothetical protein
VIQMRAVFAISPAGEAARSAGHRGNPAMDAGCAGGLHISPQPAGAQHYAPADACLPSGGTAPVAADQRGGRGLFLAGWVGAVLICLGVWLALIRAGLAHGQELRVVFLICPPSSAWCEESEMRWPRPITCDAAEAYIRAGLREGQTLMVQACEMVQP